MHGPVYSNNIAACRIECEKLPDQCSIDICKIEMGIGARLIALWASSQNIVESLLHSEGFDYANECQARRGIPGDKDCCGGDYPDRFVYKRPLGSQRYCCNDHTYDRSTLDCCSDGTSKAIGTCPPVIG